MITGLIAWFILKLDDKEGWWWGLLIGAIADANIMMAFANAIGGCHG